MFSWGTPQHTTATTNLWKRSLKAYLRNTPSTPVTPMPSTMSRVKRKGTVSGVGRMWPCSKAIPVYAHTHTHTQVTHVWYGMLQDVTIIFMSYSFLLRSFLYSDICKGCRGLQLLSERRRKRLQSWDPKERKKTTDKVKTPWREREREKKNYRWSQNPTEKKKTKRLRPHRKEKTTKWRPQWEKKDYRWSRNPTEKKKTTDEAKTPRRRKRLQMKPKPHGEEKDYKVETHTEKKRLQTKLRRHGEKKDYKDDRQCEDPTEKKTTDKQRPHPPWSYPGRCGWAQQSCSLSRCSSRGDRPVPGCSPLKHT